MAKFLSTPRLTSIHFRTVTSTLSKPPSSSSSYPIHTLSPISLHSNSFFFSLYTTPNPCKNIHRNFSVSAFDTKNDDVSSSSKDEAGPEINGDDVAKSSTKEDQYPSGEFEFEGYGAWKSLVVKFRMLFAFPWERVRKGSVLTMKLRGQISDQLQSRFSSGLSLPQICENLMKAAYDPRISGVYLHIEPLGCGWGKVEEIRRHILDFRKSGKFIVGYVPACGEKEYYIGCACQELYAPPSAYFALYGLTVQASFLGGVFEKVGIEPQVQRIGKYKSAGDQLMRKSISDENREMITALLDNIYGNWLEKVALTKGKKKEDIEQFVDDGVYQVERLKEESWITDIKYDDEVMSMLKERLGIPKDKKLPEVDYRKYSKVRRWTLGQTGFKDQIAVIRASGSISRTRGPFSSPSSGIIAEKLIEKIRSVRESKRYKAVVLRIDSPGGDALASDLMWREIRLLAESKPVIASMADVAASGGYYMAMAAQAVVAENLTLTGSIGVVTGKFNLGNLYERIGFNKETISRGRYAELTAAEQRPFRPEEAELFAKSAQHAYTQFRDKAALSRSMKVSVVELSRPSASLPELLSGIGSSLAGADRTLKELLNDVASSDGIQARMDGVMFEKLGGAAYTNPLFMLIKDCLSSF
ncbi:serine protease SPPA, chloroplastic isoform X2 [Lycium ferocissimum]|uniref:serine protease SPPA, chloroplastic isoform X2 n=1 Tax=Lycium ferocissimum TaxID=112874 RepID=UPI002815AEBD|nr:serine protease SPPA, chloroplastic isoform X2 [Lycium ferocissimum]